jgi:hypothetical protein
MERYVWDTQNIVKNENWLLADTINDSGLHSTDLPPEKESRYNVSKIRQKRGDKWSGKPILQSKSSTS